MNRISCFSILALLLFHHFSFSQTVDPFSIRYQNQQKGGIVMLANVSVSCTNCAATTSQVPPSGTGQNNNVTMNYVDSDSDPTTFMSSSDSLNLANCSEVLWAGLYWSARVGKTGLAPSTVTNYTLRNQIKIKVGNGAYQNLTADELLDNTVGHQTYHCFKKITSLVQANGVKARYTVADLVTRTGTEVYGGWTIVVVYKNVYQSMRNLTVFDGLANVSSGNSVTIPISGFLTPIVGPVNFELGVVSHDGDRSQTGDQLQFNGVGTTYVNVSDALHPLNDVFNSTIARNAVLTPFRNPSFNNTLGHDASVFFPTNTTFNYIGNNASSANIRITTGNETILTSVVTSVIDVYEPDLRATVYMQDLNGGTVNPGDVLEYTLVGKNIGSDISTGTYMTDTLDVRTTYVPGSISVFYGPNSGLKTDAYLDDQAEYDPVNRVVRVRIGNGANATTGGTVASSSTGLDSTVVKFRVTLVNDCVAFQCDPTLEHKAYIFGSGNISGNAYNNGGLSDLLDANGCPTIANDILSVNVTGCPPINITTNPPICVGDLLTLTAPSSFGGIYSWTGPNAFSSAGQSSISIPNVTSANSGQYAVSINFPSLNCTLDTTKIVTILPNPTIQLASSSNVSCFGGNNGALAITNTGTAPYSYLWTNGNISANPTGLIAGSYSVTVTDANTCFTTATYTVTQPTAVTGVTTATSDFNGFDVSCFGSSNGVANVVASGGTSGYTYLWTNGSTASTAINLPAGTASVTITDANLCTSIIPVTLTQPSDLISSATKTDVSCFSGNNGTIDLSASGGVQPYSYSWSNTQTSQDLSSLTSGTYSVTVTDLNNCQDLLSIAVFQPSAPLTLSQTQQNVLCFNQLTGSVDLTPTGGTAPYSYLWSNGAITQDLSGLGAGNYTVTVTDSKLCTANLTVTITQPAQPISATTAITNVACFGFTTGAIDITVSSGVSPYTYLWSNGAVTADIVNIGAASYGVTITDFNSCSLVLTNLVVNQPASPVQTTVSNVNVACFSGSTGSINITPSGGVSPYTYSWSNGAITQDLINLTAGTYNLVTTDFNGCTKLNSVVISQPLSPLSLAETHLNVLCFNQLTGSIDLTPTGGTAPYSYLWSNGAITQDLSGLGAGNYSVTVRDANLCTANILVTITQPSQAISLSRVITNVACYQESTGSIDLSVLGGTAPYTYSWSNGSINQDLINAPASMYSVLVTDVNGCSAFLSNLTITQPSAPLIVALVQSDVSCYGGSDGLVATMASGGTAPYTYAWSNGQTTMNINNLQAGNYTLVTTDANGCSFTYVSFVTEPLVSLISSESHENILCHGAQTGSINVSPSGGTMPYTYLWSNGATTEDLFGVSSGTYSLVITDYNLCTNNISVTLAQPLLPITPTTAITNVLCHDQNNGAINLSVVGGSAPYTYLWNNGVILQDLTNYPANSYSVTITDASGCVSTLPNLAITQPSMPLAVNLVGDNINCFAGNDGSIITNITGGTAPYVFQWSNSATTQNPTGLAAGSYSVLITDANNCTISASINLTQPGAPLVVTETHVDILCYGLSTGSSNTTVTGGTLPYSYSWNSGQSTEDLTNITSGNYILTVTDAESCTVSVTSVVTQPNAPLTLTETHLDAICLGGIQGSIDLTVSGGTAPYLYTWNNGSNVQDQPNLFAGFYESSVVDANGCSDTIDITILDPTNSLLVTQSITDIVCFAGATGIINLTSSGGTPGYAYSWSTGAATEDVSGLEAGNYWVTVSDANSCGIFLNFSVQESPTPIVVSSVVSNVLCIGDMNGAINASVSGGISPYTYSWSNGPLTQDISAIGAGNYTLNVTDNIGCVSSYNATVLQLSQVTINETHNNVACFGENSGSIDVTPVGGIPNLTYLWSNGATTQDLFLLTPGTYSLSLTDGLGCVTPLSVVITQPAAPLLVMNSITNVSCFGNSNGMLDITVSGGTTPYVYTWNNGTSTEDQLGIVAGIYLLNVTDVNGCEILDSYTITQPSFLDVTYTSVNVNCFGGNNGSINLSVSGGEIPYSYSWSNGAIVQDINNLTAGVYTVIVRDAYNCQQVIPITIAQPLAPLSVTESHSNIACFGQSTGTIDILPAGGTFPYTFNWSNSATTEDLTGLPIGNYSVLVTDIQGCTTSIATTLTQPSSPLIFSNNLTDVLCFSDSTGAISITTSGGALPYSYVWSNGAVTEDLNNITAGIYTFNLTDAGGCQILDTFTINQPTQLDVSLVSSNVSCFGGNNGAIDVTAVGGTAPYVYAWSNGQNSQDISQLFTGTYSLVVTDANNCSKTVSVFITQPALPLGALESHVNILCFGNATGSIDISPNGGTPSYTYSWSNGATTQDLTGVVAGNYSLIITDSLGCTFNISATLTEPLAPLSIVSSVFNVSCFGGTNGIIDVAVNGGTAPYSYVWSNGSITEDLNNVNAGVYSFNSTDANGCQILDTFTIDQPTLLEVLLVSSNVSCFGGNNGALDVTVVGGTAPYSYAWSNGENVQDISQLFPGMYSLLVTDANNCTKTVSSLITQPALPLTAIESHVNILCFGNATGSIDITPNGGTPSYSYSWSNGATTQDLTGVAAGNYSLIITDSLGCTFSILATLTQPLSPLSIVSSVFNVSCFGGSNGRIDVAFNGGTAPYTFVWSNGATTQNLSNLIAGTYTITVTDQHGCVLIETYTVTQPNPLQITWVVDDVNCFAGNDGAIDLTILGGTAPYSYIWSNSQMSQDVSGLIAGTYSVLVTDIKGCFADSTITVAQPAAPLSITENHVNVLCYGNLTGSINITVAGGTPGYDYLWFNGSVSEDLTNVAAGFYSVAITDSLGCTISISTTITEPAAPLFISNTTTNVSCFGGSDGILDITVSGGTTPYAYLWSNTSVSQDLANLVSGLYTITVTDSNACVSSQTYNVTQPLLPLSSAVNMTPVICFDDATGAAYAFANGGTAPYNFLWSNGVTADSNVNIVADLYYVIVTDTNGCTSTSFITVTEPPLLEIQISGVDVLCNGDSTGSVSVSATGGVGFYQYIWDTNDTTSTVNNLPAGYYNVIVSDANGCQTLDSITILQPLNPLSATFNVTNNLCFGESNGAIDATIAGGTIPYDIDWSNSATSEDLANLIIGDYTLVITDSNNCVLTSVVTIDEPDLIEIVNPILENVSCNDFVDGSINLTTIGGVGQYTYNWSNGAQTEDLNNIISGSYFVVVEDGNNCIQIFDYTLTQPDTINTTYTLVEPSCFAYTDGEINTTTTGGTTPYVLNWSNSASTSLIQPVGAGNYTLEITDANGCFHETQITLGQPEQIQVTLDADVFVGCDPLEVNFANNSDEQYSSNWYFGDASVGSGTQISHTYTGSGSYDVTLVITDANGCSNFAEFSDLIDVLPTPVAGINASTVYLNAAEPEAIILNTSEGATSYVWNLGDSPTDYTFYEPVNYTYPVYNQDEYLVTLVAIGLNGCTDSTQVLIEFDNRLIIYVPNSFTPNGDELNNVFKPIVPVPVKSYHFQIYNRWGELIFETFDKEEGWDGKFNGQLVQDGTYTWEISIVTSKADLFINTGNVNLFR